VIRWKEYGGRKVAYWKAERHPICEYLALGKQERWVEGKLCELVRPADLILDAGACIGQHAILLANQAAHVIAVEPDPLHACLLALTVYANGVPNVTILPCALGDRIGAVPFPGAGSCGDGFPNKLGSGSTAWRFTLDTFGFHFDGAKIDIQANEIALLHGGRDSLQGARFLLIERHTERKTDIPDHHALLYEWGFHLAAVDRSDAVTDLFLRGTT